MEQHKTKKDRLRAKGKEFIVRVASISGVFLAQARWYHAVRGGSRIPSGADRPGYKWVLIDTRVEPEYLKSITRYDYHYEDRPGHAKALEEAYELRVKTYTHFKTRAELLDALFEKAFEATQEEVWKPKKKDPPPPATDEWGNTINPAKIDPS